MNFCKANKRFRQIKHGQLFRRLIFSLLKVARDDLPVLMRMITEFQLVEVIVDEKIDGISQAKRTWMFPRAKS